MKIKQNHHKKIDFIYRNTKNIEKTEIVKLFLKKITY